MIYAALALSALALLLLVVGFFYGWSLYSGHRSVLRCLDEEVLRVKTRAGTLTDLSDRQQHALKHLTAITKSHMDRLKVLEMQALPKLWSDMEALRESVADLKAAFDKAHPQPRLFEDSAEKPR